MVGSSDIDFVLKIFAKSLSCIVTPFVRNTHGKSGNGFVCHLDRKKYNNLEVTAKQAARKCARELEVQRLLPLAGLAPTFRYSCK